MARYAAIAMQGRSLWRWLLVVPGLDLYRLLVSAHVLGSQGM
jgi:hypothetical protein